MIWLSTFELNLRNRAVRNDLRDCNNLHRTIMSLFPDVDQAPARGELGVLYRVEQGVAGGVRILLQAQAQPQFQYLPAGYLAGSPQSKPLDHIDRLLSPGRKLRFRLRANPTRAIDTTSHLDGSGNHGKRVELRGEEACVDWLGRKAEQHGFRVLACRIDAGARDPRNVSGKIQGRKAGATITVASTLFDGILEVTDSALSRGAVRTGIGRAKSYGQGLLSVAPMETPDGSP